MLFIAWMRHGSPRHSLLVDADDSLKNYGSEYHYIFKKLYEYRAHTTLNRDEAFLTANLARKLVESFSPSNIQGVEATLVN